MISKDKIINLGLILALILVVGALVYFNSGGGEGISGNAVAVGKISPNGKNATLLNLKETLPEKVIPAKKHIPVNLSDDDILVSFRYDDITFKTKQKQVLENALYLARKYNITFDLAVIAKPFDEKADPEVFKIYQDNQDVFEVVAHGWTHVNPLNKSGQGEFYDLSGNKSIPYSIQEEHIKEMKKIFEKNNLKWGEKIFILPWSSGDQNTIKIAKDQGYRIMTQLFVPGGNYEYLDETLIVSKEFLPINIRENLSDKDLENYKKILTELTKTQKRIEVILHPLNFDKTTNSEEAIKRIVNFKDPRLKFGMISDGVL